LVWQFQTVNSKPILSDSRADPGYFFYLCFFLLEHPQHFQNTVCLQGNVDGFPVSLCLLEEKDLSNKLASIWRPTCKSFSYGLYSYTQAGLKEYTSSLCAIAWILL
jgi:hypothetical protein